MNEHSREKRAINKAVKSYLFVCERWVGADEWVGGFGGGWLGEWRAGVGVGWLEGVCVGVRWVRV